MILEFQGEHRWLSNFVPVKIILGGIEYSSVEHAYMSAKSNDPPWKKICSDPNIKPGEIKKLGRNIKLRPNWDNIKFDIMKECLKQKFSQEPFRTKLLKTGNQNIQEGNRWGDEIWGVNLNRIPNRGENHLGRLIMEIRKEHRAALSI